jgi:hypothetical protein
MNFMVCFIGLIGVSQSKVSTIGTMDCNSFDERLDLIFCDCLHRLQSLNCITDSLIILHAV